MITSIVRQEPYDVGADAQGRHRLILNTDLLHCAPDVGVTVAESLARYAVELVTEESLQVGSTLIVGKDADLDGAVKVGVRFIDVPGAPPQGTYDDFRAYIRSTVQVTVYSREAVSGILLAQELAIKLSFADADI